MGLAWDRPLAYTRDFIAGLQPLLAGGVADVDGDAVTTHAELNIVAADTPILLAALGPKMLELAGRRVQGTTLGQCGPRTIASYVAPALRAAADAAGRPAPRIMALIRICVTDDHGPAYALARETAARYRTVPSYEAVQDMEGLAEPADLHLIGSWERVARRARRVRRGRRHRLPPRGRRPGPGRPGGDPGRAGRAPRRPVGDRAGPSVRPDPRLTRPVS